MRPVNLIPPEERTGSRAPTRTGPVMYAVLGGLALLFLGMTLLVTTSNSISERRTERDRLKSLEQAAQAEAQRFGSYVGFKDIQQRRIDTVNQLARSRFDWERVMRELALVLPDDVWLTNLTATASPATALEGGKSVALRKDVQGPALELVGCGRGHESVARFLTRLRNIDGVTRVGVTKSERSERAGGGESETGGGGGAGGDCRVRDTIALFEVVVGFEQVVTPTGPAPVSPPPGGAQPASGTPSQAGGQPTPGAPAASRQEGGA